MEYNEKHQLVVESEAGKMVEIWAALAEQAGLIIALTFPIVMFTLIFVLDRQGDRPSCDEDNIN